MKSKIRQRFWELLVLVFCMVILCIGISRKEGFHMDELLSYELANAEFNPWIVPTQPEGRLAKFVREEIDGESLWETLGNLADTVSDVLQNRGNSRLLTYKAKVYDEPVWISAEWFQSYIGVDSGDAFNYLSVYFNVKDDNHPPFHFMLLHTVCSVFRGGTWVWVWAGCGINLICAAVCMIFLMKTGRLLAETMGMKEKGRLAGLLAALCYGCSSGAMATVLLIRMYGVVSCLCVVLFYLHLKKWLTAEFDRRNKSLIAVTVLGFLTQYFFLFYCITLAAVTVLLLWQGKRHRECRKYVCAMAVSAVIGLCLFPFAVSDVFSSGRGVEALGNLSAGLSGYGERLLAFGKILADRTFGIVLFGVGAVAVLFCAGRGIRVLKDEKNKAVSLALLIFPAAGYFLLAARMSPYLVDRYIMPVFPFVMLMGALLLTKAGILLEKWFGKKMLLVPGGAVIVFLLCGLVQYDGSYLYQGYAQQLELAGEYAALPCICVYDGVGYYENLLEFAEYSKTLLVRETELAERQDTESISSLDEVLVLIKEGVDEEAVCTLLTERYGLKYAQELLSEGVHGDKIIRFQRQEG